MLGSSIALLLIAFAAIRFPELPVLALLPATLGASIASVMKQDRGAWIIGLLAGALMMRFPNGALLGLVVAAAPAAAALLRRYTSVHPGLVAAVCVPLATYLASAAGSGSFALPFGHLLDLCAAVAIGATLSVLAYAPTQREQLGPRGRTGFRIR